MRAPIGRTLPLLVLGGSIGFGALALAEEPIPQAPTVPMSPGAPAVAGPPREGARPEGVVGDADAAKAKQADEAAAAKKQSNRPKDEATDNDKASQSGNDATLRQLPSPAQRGSE